jgi:hypothetical protein
VKKAGGNSHKTVLIIQLLQGRFKRKFLHQNRAEIQLYKINRVKKGMTEESSSYRQRQMRNIS